MHHNVICLSVSLSARGCCAFRADGIDRLRLDADIACFGFAHRSSNDATPLCPNPCTTRTTGWRVGHLVSEAVGCFAEWIKVVSPRGSCTRLTQRYWGEIAGVRVVGDRLIRFVCCSLIAAAVTAFALSWAPRPGARQPALRRRGGGGHGAVSGGRPGRNRRSLSNLCQDAQRYF